jgi:Septum formation
VTTPPNDPPPPGFTPPEPSPYGPPPGSWQGSLGSSAAPTPPSKAMAWWSFGLSFAWCLPFVAGLTSIGLAIGVLVRGRDGRDHGKGLAIAAIVIASVGILAAASEVPAFVRGLQDGFEEARQEQTTPRGEDGQVTETGQISPLDLQEGDCFDDSSVAAEGVEVTTVVVKPCPRRHDLEVYHVQDISTGGFGYPGEDEAIARSDAVCAGEFDDFVGRPLVRSRLVYTFYYPTATAWRLGGQRDALCAIADSRGRTEGSLRGAKR